MDSNAGQTLSHVAIDARMVQHSGIGTAIRGLLDEWRAAPPPFKVTLMGPRGLLEPYAAQFNIAEYDAGIYGPTGILLPAPVGDAEVVLGMHYTVPLLPVRPLVCVVHDLIHITHPTRPGTAAYMSARLAMLRPRASYIVTPSRHTKVQLQTLHGFPAHRVLTLPWGPGLAGSDNPTAKVMDGDYLLAVGIWKPHKNWRFLIERLAGMYRGGEIPPGMRLAAAGLNEKGREALLQLALESGIREKVVALDRLDDSRMRALYAGSTALLFPSLAEGFGFPLLEAMAAGTPCVAANLPPMNEFGAAALFEPDVPESFDRALAAILHDSEYRRTLVERGRVEAARHSWKKFAERLADVLSRAHAENRAK